MEAIVNTSQRSEANIENQPKTNKKESMIDSEFKFWSSWSKYACKVMRNEYFMEVLGIVNDVSAGNKYIGTHLYIWYMYERQATGWRRESNRKQ